MSLPVIVMTIVLLPVLSNFRRRLHQLKQPIQNQKRSSVDIEHRPYILRKGELETEGTAKYELEAIGTLPELGAEIEIREMRTIQASELRYRESCKELK